MQKEVVVGTEASLPIMIDTLLSMLSITSCLVVSSLALASSRYLDALSKTSMKVEGFA